jgi:hypothetical protein
MKQWRNFHMRTKRHQDIVSTARTQKALAGEVCCTGQLGRTKVHQPQPVRIILLFRKIRSIVVKGGR